jgi:hypothetical protein
MMPHGDSCTFLEITRVSANKTAQLQKAQAYTKQLFHQPFLLLFGIWFFLPASFPLAPPPTQA